MTSEQSLPGLGRAPHVFGRLSYIPLIGVPFGIGVIIYGLITKKAGGKKLAIVGTGGIAFTIVLYSSLFYFAVYQPHSMYDEMETKIARNQLTQLVVAIEYYKAQNGHYPESLDVLRKFFPGNSHISIADPTDMIKLSLTDPPRHFYYQLADPEHYYLLGVGPDGKPFTSDDILPQIDPRNKTGLLISDKSHPAASEVKR